MTEIKNKNVKTSRKETNFTMIMKRLVKNKLAMFGGIVLIILCLAAIFAPLIAPYSYAEVDPLNKFASPSLQHLFGTDQYGRDIFSRVVYGSRWSLTMGVSAALVSLVGGAVIGVTAGYFGGWVDSIVMRIIDIVQSMAVCCKTSRIRTAPRW